MKTFRLLLLFTFLPNALFCQDISNSIGVVTLSSGYDNSDHILQFLNDDGSVWNSINLYDDWKPIEDFIIIGFHPDYFLFEIKCKSKLDKYYEVIVNEETGLTKRLLISSKLKLQTWEEYVLDVFSIGFDSSKTSIFEEIEGEILPQQPPKNQTFVPKEIKGEWMRIIWTDSNYPTDDSINYSGWIKWKEENKISIWLYHMA